MTAQSQPSVFISHARVDAADPVHAPWFAFFRRFFKMRGYEVVLTSEPAFNPIYGAQSDRGGNAAILQKVREASLVVGLWSKAASESAYCRDERAAALVLGKLVLFSLDPTPSDGLTSDQFRIAIPDHSVEAERACATHILQVMRGRCLPLDARPTRTIVDYPPRHDPSLVQGPTSWTFGDSDLRAQPPPTALHDGRRMGVWLADVVGVQGRCRLVVDKTMLGLPWAWLRAGDSWLLRDPDVTLSVHEGERRAFSRKELDRRWHGSGCAPEEWEPLLDDRAFLNPNTFVVLESIDGCDDGAEKALTLLEKELPAMVLVRAARPWSDPVIRVICCSCVSVLAPLTLTFDELHRLAMSLRDDRMSPADICRQWNLDAGESPSHWLTCFDPEIAPPDEARP